jgi:hypothetical protein
MCTGRQTITRTPLSGGGDECDADSLSLLIHIYIHRHTSMHFLSLKIPDNWLPNSDSLSLLIQSYIPVCILVCLSMYIFVLFVFVFLSIPYIWLTNCLFLLDTGGLFCPATSCPPWNPVFLPGFHRFREYACFWAEYWDAVVEWKCSCVTVCIGRQTDTVERLAK